MSLPSLVHTVPSSPQSPPSETIKAGRSCGRLTGLEVATSCKERREEVLGREAGAENCTCVPSRAGSRTLSGVGVVVGRKFPMWARAIPREFNGRWGGEFMQRDGRV